MNIDFTDENSCILSKSDYEKIDNKDFVISSYDVSRLDSFDSLEEIESCYKTGGFVILNNFNEIFKKQITKIQNYYNISYNLAKVIYGCYSDCPKNSNITINDEDEFIIIVNYESGNMIKSCNYIDLFNYLHGYYSHIYDKDGNRYDVRIDKFSLIKNSSHQEG